MAIEIEDVTVKSPETTVLTGDKEEGELEAEVSKLAHLVVSKYFESKSDREIKEAQWLSSYRNFIGRWDQDQPYTDTERNSTFLKVTKTKTLAVYGNTNDVLFSTDNSIPIGIQPTPVPTGTTQYAHIPLTPAPAEPEQIQEGLGFPGDGTREGETGEESLSDAIVSYFAKLTGKSPAKGEATSKEELFIDPAQQAAEKMERKIRDQLIESDGGKVLRKAILEAILLGTGCIKGPMREFKEIPRWTEEGAYDPIILDNQPVCSHVSIWDIFPDPDARSLEEAEWIIERHRMSKKEMIGLKNKKYFIKDQVSLAVERGANYRDEDWEYENDDSSKNSTQNRYEVFEFWGSIDREELEDIEEFDFPEGSEDEDIFDVNLWVCNGVVMRAVINPYEPNRLPYFLFPYEEDPYNIFGVGIPENMQDSQELINGFTRIAVDNAALASNIMIEIEEDRLVPGQDLSISAGKVWRKEAGESGPALNPITFPNTFQSAMNVVDTFRRWADDTTGIPSALHGQTGVTGIGRTASGISQLLGAAGLAIKSFIKNIDDYLLEPLGKAYYSFNMQFNFDETIGSDLEVKPLGSLSLAQKEIQSQKLLQFLQVTGGDQELLARRNTTYILEEIAKALDLDPKKVTLSPEKTLLKMEQLREAGVAPEQPGGQQNQQQLPQAQGQPPVAPPQPGEPGFSGAPLGGDNAEIL